MPTMLPSNNLTISGIKSDSERNFWIVYLSIVLISTLFGGTVILVASIRYNAFKLNKFIVVVIQHMAVCDLIASVAFTLPTITSMMADEWVLGTTSSYLERLFVHLSFPLTNTLICVLTSSKLLLLLFPLRTRTWSRMRAHVVCAVCWATATLYSGVELIHYWDSVYFNYATYDIDYRSETELDKVFSIAVDSVYFIMITIVMVTTVFTLKYLFEARKVARRAKSTRSPRWHGIFTVVLTAVVFCVSTIPWTVHRIAEQFVAAPPEMMYFHTTLKRVAEYLPMLSVTSNFYIYCVTVPSFRLFLLSRITTVSPTFSMTLSRDKIEESAANSAVADKSEQQT